MERSNLQSRFIFSWVLMFVFNFILNSYTAATSLDDTIANSNFRINRSILSNVYSGGNSHERVRRASSSEISGAEHGVGLTSTFLHNEGVVLGVATAFCLSLMLAVACIFCDGCDEEKSSDIDGPSGYVGEIDLADIQVIYNPSAGAPRLPPHTHQNEAFEDIVLGNPAILQVSSCDVVGAGALSNGHKPTVPNQNPVLREVKSNALSRRLAKDEQGNGITLGYENSYAAGFRTDLARYQTEKPSRFPVDVGENAVQSSADLVHSTASVITSRNYFVDGRDYDMNDVTIKNMNARY